jgi:hypothetical protein
VNAPESRRSHLSVSVCRTRRDHVRKRLESVRVMQVPGKEEQPAYHGRKCHRVHIRDGGNDLFSICICVHLQDSTRVHWTAKARVQVNECHEHRPRIGMQSEHSTEGHQR